MEGEKGMQPLAKAQKQGKGGKGSRERGTHRRTPIEAIPTPDLAVPYAAPRSVGGGKRATFQYGRAKMSGGAAFHANSLANTSAAATPMKPKKGADSGHRGLAPSADMAGLWRHKQHKQVSTTKRDTPRATQVTPPHTYK